MFIMHFLKFFRAPTYEAVGQISVGQIFAFNTSFDLGMHKVVPFGLENLNLKFN